jgi:IS4 transposase
VKNDPHSDKMEVTKNKKLVSMLSNFPNIINKFLGDLPKDDYPVLDTFKFVSCWLSFVMDQSQSSMSDLFDRTEFRLATNLPESGEFAVSNEEVGEFYRSRWQIELLWKFLKIHLKLDRLITKNTNGK